MSGDVNSKGFMAILKNPILDSDERGDLFEKLYDDSTNLYVNYEGTMIYNITEQSDYGWYCLSIEGEKIISDKNGKKEFINMCKINNLEIDEKTIRSYSCTWYNGSDSDMGMLKVEEYKKRIKK